MDAKLMALQDKHGTAELAGSKLGWSIHTKNAKTGKIINLTQWFFRLPSEAVDDAYRTMRISDEGRGIPVAKST